MYNSATLTNQDFASSTARRLSSPILETDIIEKSLVLLNTLKIRITTNKIR